MTLLTMVFWLVVRATYVDGDLSNELFVVIGWVNTLTLQSSDLDVMSCRSGYGVSHARPLLLDMVPSKHSRKCLIWLDSLYTVHV